MLIHVDGNEYYFPTGKHCTPAQLEENILKVYTDQKTSSHAIGIAIPGLIDRQGIVVESDVLPNLAGWDPIKNFSHIKYITTINDANAALLECANDILDSGCVMLITIGTGIGCAISYNGNYFEGNSGYAGELGSIPIPSEDGPVKLDAVASGAAIVRNLDKTAEEIITALLENAETELNEIDKAAEGMGYALATCLNLLNPTHIFLSGGTLLYPGYFDKLQETTKQWSIPALYNNCTIHNVSASKSIVALGAARAVKMRMGNVNVISKG